MNEHWRGTLEMSAAMAILGSIGYFVLLSGQPVSAVVFWRCAFGALTLLPICAAMGLLRGRMTLRAFILAVLGGLAIVTNWWLLFKAYAFASISVATVVYNTQPFMLIAFGAVLFGERVTPARFRWLCLSFAGVVLMLQARPAASYVGSDHLWGIVLALAAAFFWAIAAVIAKRLAGTPPQLIALIQVTVGVVVLAPVTSFTALPSGPQAWSALVLVGVVHTGLMYILMYSAVQRLPTVMQGALSFIYPVAAMLVDRFALGHTLQTIQIAGAAAILAGAAGVSLNRPSLAQGSAGGRAPDSRDV